MYFYSAGVRRNQKGYRFAFIVRRLCCGHTEADVQPMFWRETRKNSVSSPFPPFHSVTIISGIHVFCVNKYPPGSVADVSFLVARDFLLDKVLRVEYMRRETRLVRQSSVARLKLQVYRGNTSFALGGKRGRWKRAALPVHDRRPFSTSAILCRCTYVVILGETPIAKGGPNYSYPTAVRKNRILCGISKWTLGVLSEGVSRRFLPLAVSRAAAPKRGALNI